MSEYSSSILGQLLLKARARNYANEFQIPRDFQGPMTSLSSPADETPDSRLGSSGPSSIIHSHTHVHTVILICKFYSVCVCEWGNEDSGTHKRTLKEMLMFLEV